MNHTVTLDPSIVERIFLDCLFQDGEDTADHIAVEGIVHNIGFHPGRLESHRDEVVALLGELPTEFMSAERGGGGGWSFLNACNDRHGNLWTGMHLVMEQLFSLGIALGLAEYQLPREMWPVLPGGMPYIVIK
mgnify:CR=1 FL=1